MAKDTATDQGGDVENVDLLSSAPSSPQPAHADQHNLLFESRFLTSFHNATTTRMTADWRNYIKKYNASEWCQMISDSTLPEVKALLGREEVPTWEDIQAWEWIDTPMAGRLLLIIC